MQASHWIAALIGLSPVAASAANVLVNPGFESGSVTGWTDVSAQWSATTATPFAGTYCATTPNNFELRQTFVGVPVAFVTELSLYTRHASNVTGASDIYIAALYSDSTNSPLIYSPTPITSWTKVDFTSLLTPGKTLTGITFYGNALNATYVDNVVVNAVPEPSLAAGFACVLPLLRRRRRGA